VLSQRPAARWGAINASTVFALTLAIVAGLILTLVFKMVVLDRKSTTPTVTAATVKLTVAAVNVLDRASIEPGYIKTIDVPVEERNRWLKEASNRKTRLLDGSQPVGRTTVKALRAEEPVFEDMLEPFQYPRPVSELLAPGKRAAIVEVPATQAMIQVGDHVDLLCTMSNDTAGFGVGNTATAILTRGAKVVARFNTTRTAALPPAGSANRSYTLETSPYRYAMIELAKSIGARFALSVSPRTSEDGNGNGNGLLQMGMSAEADDPETDRVTTGDLARLFGIVPASPGADRTWEVERFSGLERGPSLLFTNYNGPNSPPGRSNPPVARAAGTALPPSRSDSAQAKSMVSASLSDQPNGGFRPVEDPNGCKTCGGKKR
jgi:Flp pilus assembly protein CpaB